MKRAVSRGLLTLLGAVLLGGCSAASMGPPSTGSANRQPDPTPAPAETSAATRLPVEDGGSTGEVLIDFEACESGRRRIDLAFGSTTYEIRERRPGECVLAYGGEIENPEWDGSLPWVCLVPRNLGTVAFRADSPYAVDFSPIEAYCTNTDD